MQAAVADLVNHPVERHGREAGIRDREAAADIAMHAAKPRLHQRVERIGITKVIFRKNPWQNRQRGLSSGSA